MRPLVYTVTWSDDTGLFQFVSTRPTPELVLTDGRSVALPTAAWLALRDVLRLLPDDRAHPGAPPSDALPPGGPPAGPPGPARRGKPWADAEERVLTEEWARGEPAEAIGRSLGRSRGAVVARLVKLGLVEEAEANLRFPPGRADRPTAPVVEEPADPSPPA